MDDLNSSVVRALAVDKVYGGGQRSVHALSGVTLEVSRGEFVALVGRSGCGKTTLLNLLGAMDTPTKGEVWLTGINTASLSDDALTVLRRRKVGFVFQFFHLLPTLTVQENVELPLILDGRLDEARRRAEALLDAVGMLDRAADFPNRLSGGEMQRVAIARALVHDPELIIADEPTGNLDNTSASSVLRILRGLASDHHSAVVMATHSSDAASSADRVVEMVDGRVVAIHGAQAVR